MIGYYRVIERDGLLVLAVSPHEPRSDDLVVLELHELARLQEDAAMAQAVRERAVELAAQEPTP